LHGWLVGAEPIRLAFLKDSNGARLKIQELGRHLL
jgi:hypothetical protein